MTNITYESVGKLCMDWYVAETERVNARNQRATARASHRCLSAEYPDTPPCWLDPQPSSITSHLPEWCDNCKYVQPYHEAFIAAAEKSRRLRYQLTRRIRQMMINEGAE